MALDQQWHIWCFKCGTCGTVLHGEYMGKDGVPYCERDYQKQFGVKCAYCNRYISGKVLQVIAVSIDNFQNHDILDVLFLPLGPLLFVLITVYYFKYFSYAITMLYF